MNCDLKGVPLGLKAAAYDYATKGMWYISPDNGYLRQALGRTLTRTLIVEKDNAYDVWALDRVAIPDGYARDDRNEEDWFRPVRIGDTILGMDGNPYVVTAHDLHLWKDKRRIIIYPVSVSKKDGINEYSITLNVSVFMPESVVADLPSKFAKSASGSSGSKGAWNKAIVESEAIRLELIRQIAKRAFSVSQLTSVDKDEDEDL